jgi:uncharacterized protein (TIGR02246 family)
VTDDERLAALCDRESIRTQITRFGRYLDERRWEEYAALYCEDGVLELPFGSWTGRTSILARVKADLAEYVATQHVSANHDVEVDGDNARARTTFIATHVTAEGGTAFWRGGGVYELELRRVDGAWQIARVAISPVWRSATGAAFPAH